ncbi:MAG: amidohydrolase family protein [Candidatus Thermoplasmatota archaeon]|nr:amidohydrolase family protein [Candidatus Thermoplasmatota archaeon]
MVSSYLLKDGQYFDHNKGEFINGDIFIIDGKISLNEPSPKEKMEVINCREKFIVPSFFDCHVHLNWSGSSNPIDDTIKDGPLGAIIRAYRNSMKSLASGITNLVDVGSFNDVAVNLAGMINRGVIFGPDILAAGRILCITGGHGAGMGYEINGPVEALSATRTLIKKGADLIKIAATSGAYGDTGAEKLESYQMNEDEIRAVTSEAHKFFIKVTAHALNPVGIHNALINGVDVIQHGAFLNKEDATFMFKNNRSLVPTLYVYRKLAQGGPGVMGKAVEKSRMVVENHNEAFATAMKAGVNIASGTDAGSPNLGDHPTLIEEVITMQEIGMSEADCIRAMTINAARAFGVQDSYGSIENGKKANLVLLGSNPLESVHNLYDVKSIIKSGRFLQKNDILSSII